MKWRRYWPESLFLVLVVALEGTRLGRHDTRASTPWQGASWTTQRKLESRERIRELWYHGFDNYMNHAFPLDELTPLTCSGQGPDWANPNNIASNDVAGNFSLTLIDVLDTFIVLDDRQGFDTAVKNVIQSVSFDVNTRPQVFETTIRVLGGLLSGHIFANQTGQPFYLPWYRGELLQMAHDLGKRLLPAFSTPTGLPYARINLRHGLARGETLETCTAGAGSLMLEFATLSRLTGDDRFEKAAYKAFFALWNRKTDIGLVGNTINTWTGDWTAPEITGIGAGVDSFYEYALKWYILSGEIEFLDVWDDAYASIMRYSRATDGFWYRNVNIKSGDTAYYTVDSLSAFWPGLQVLAGDVDSAVKLHMMYYNLWRRYSGLPEVFDTNFKQATSHQYPLRPEFIESTWYLYRATQDPFYLDVGERILFDIITRSKVDCGLSGIQDLRTNKRDDRMESFALSETLKYLYLLFDEENPLHSDDSNYVFTTEGHILTLGPESFKSTSLAQRKSRKIMNHQCPAYVPPRLPYDTRSIGSGLVKGIRSRGDVDYARELVSIVPTEAERNAWSIYGWCERPKADLFTYDFILSPGGMVVPEDLSPSLLKVALIPEGFMVNNVTGIRVHIVRRLDGKGYEIRKLGHYSVRPGQLVYINDTSLFASQADIGTLKGRDPDVLLRFHIEGVDPMPRLVDIQDLSDNHETYLTAWTGFFGGDLSLTAHYDQKPLRFADPDGLPIYRADDNLLGCSPYSASYQDSVILTYRGDCTFLQKLLMAQSAGAAGVLVVSDEDVALNPTANADELSAVGDLGDVVIAVLPRQAGNLIDEMMDMAENRGTGRITVTLDPSRYTESVEEVQDVEDQGEPSNRILYLNGHPLLNTRLLV
ncbi:alpha mannosidase-like protein [Guyanagaster necrorhizus]|uniref:alpha-1,2-Mannosidase n=1 Tax=Guyanagaster necrorhizus TaxID=856835 RepID=A0A9P7VYW1_9AGAR|nr:alpha mannosidase-like protein [Guyanagaster necrorhizus MCA 3950]KAG7449275.1 alpha mannosidase-like protein [Guyanagaster necrorhizus MCA 3950]